MQQPAVLSAEALRSATARLLEAADVGGDFTLQQLPGGGNNRVFRVEADGARALLKAYFQHPEDRRDRLGAEFGLCTFAWDNGLRSLPRPLACDRDHRLGLYEFIEGRQLLLQEVDEGVVRQALTFFLEVNRHRQLPAAQVRPVASEAYFTLADHLACVERRLDVLRRIELSSEINGEAAGFVRDDMLPVWGGVRGWVEKQARALGLTLNAEMPRADRRLSPSDFGFHNAILTDGGRLRFIDFEYSGWDDPAKTVSDFFCQVAVPVPLGHFDLVVDSLASSLAEPRQFRGRVDLLAPVYRMKWCCILLNEFVRVSSSRRQFANAGSTQEKKKVIQLHKARRMLQHLTDRRGTYGLH
jgi:hypothetical protein